MAPSGPPRRVRLGAYAICRDSAGRLLLCHVAPGLLDAGRWTLPGGGVEFGEHPADAALRELREESGLDGELGAVEFVHSLLVPPGQSSSGQELHLVGVVYAVRVTGGRLRPEVDGSTDGCVWHDLAAASRLELTDLARQALDLVTARKRRLGRWSERSPGHPEDQHRPQ